MDGFGASSYGDAFADVYDRWYGDLPGLADTLGTVRRLAGTGPVLELACGTGRLCLPLTEHGLVVHGVDSSEAMLQRLRAKPGGDQVTVHQADMADFTLAGTPSFTLCFLAFNSLFNLATPAAQASCFAAVARHLAPGGRFAIECAVPGDPPAEVHDAVDVHTLAVDRVVLRVSRQDPTSQTITGQHVEISERGIRLRPWLLRYSTVAEIDAMAAGAGLALEQRWAGWDGSPFGPDAAAHVSVYRRPAGSDPAERGAPR